MKWVVERLIVCDNLVKYSVDRRRKKSLTQFPLDLVWYRLVKLVKSWLYMIILQSFVHNQLYTSVY